MIEERPQSSLVLYQSEDGRTRVQCRFDGGTVWLTQAQLAELFQTTPQNITIHLMAVYREELALCGKPFPKDLPVFKEVFCAKDRRTAIEMAAPYLGGKYRDYATWGQDKVMPDAADFSRSFEALTEGRFILGTPEDCYRQLEPYWAELGCSHLVVRTNWAGMPASLSLQSMRLISDELLPALRKVTVRTF